MPLLLMVTRIGEKYNVKLLINLRVTLYYCHLVAFRSTYIATQGPLPETVDVRI